MPRAVDYARRTALLDAAVDHVIERGFADLSWRPVSAALGVSPTALVHHFGTKEQLLQAILGRVRERILAATTDALGEEKKTPADAARIIWCWSAEPRHEDLFRLFFAVYGLALQRPSQFEAFLGRVVTDWMTALRPSVGHGAMGEDAAARKTLIIATIRGLLLDLLTTGDRPRVERAFEIFVAALDGPSDAVAQP